MIGQLVVSQVRWINFLFEFLGDPTMWGDPVPDLSSELVCNETVVVGSRSARPIAGAAAKGSGMQ